MSEPDRGGPARRGFTLLEVLVAVALLGIVVSVLARTAIQGMSYEGDAVRRTRASLLADRALWTIEAGLKLAAPQPVHQESEEGEDFTVTVDVQPLALGPTGFEGLLPPRQKAKGASRAAEAETTAGAAKAAVAAPVPPDAITLFQILVRVSWVEGLRELSVTRSTFAYDASAAAEALGSEAAQGAAPPSQGQGQGSPAGAEEDEGEEP